MKKQFVIPVWVERGLKGSGVSIKAVVSSPLETYEQAGKEFGEWLFTYGMGTFLMGLREGLKLEK
jgi:hypothetical protein